MALHSRLLPVIQGRTTALPWVSSLMVQRRWRLYARIGCHYSFTHTQQGRNGAVKNQRVLTNQTHDTEMRQRSCKVFHVALLLFIVQQDSADISPWHHPPALTEGILFFMPNTRPCCSLSTQDLHFRRFSGRVPWTGSKPKAKQTKL